MQDSLPPLLYGIAWREDRTETLVNEALGLGFQGIDTANQRKHYDEAAVGQALAHAISTGLILREKLFVQTKFTFSAGQDHRLLYSPRASVTNQVEQSFASSLEHLQLTWVNSYLLHGPSQHVGLGSADWEAWRAMEKIQQRGEAKSLGISNVSLAQLQELCAGAHIRPSYVQNRCYAVHQWDRDVRVYCATQGIDLPGILAADRE